MNSPRSNPTGPGHGERPRRATTRDPQNRSTPQRAGSISAPHHGKGGPGATRDCLHAGEPHVHGTRTAYVRDRCHCAACRAANAAASRAAYRRVTAGGTGAYVDAAPAREHIAALRSAGIGLDQIARLAGLSPGHLRSLVYGRGSNRPPQRRVRPHTARQILAVPATDASRAGPRLIDATGTRRRLQALTAIGWPQAWLADALGRDPANLRRSITGTRVTATTADAVAQLYDRRWDNPPNATSTPGRSAITAARAYAGRHSWQPPMAWDDIDTDPDTPSPDPCAGEDIDEIAVERAMAGDNVGRLTRAEELEVVRRLTDRGSSLRTIATLINATTRTVSRHRQRCHAA